MAVRMGGEEEAEKNGGGASARLLARSIVGRVRAETPGHYKVLFEGRVGVYDLTIVASPISAARFWCDRLN